MSAGPIDLGPFQLLEPVAAGGMAVVWKGIHREHGVPVAVKVVRRAYATRPTFLRRFQEEVRAVAALNHPGIAMVLDHGTIDSATAAKSDKLSEGQPWLAMEYCSGGTLSGLEGLRYRSLQALLLAILDALGHAHSHGVVHRDLKPANVLVATREDARPGLKLSDFGIAHTRESSLEDAEQGLIGTPTYMAPEQIRGEWRDQGPWTDLYSLGCMIYVLATGKPPFPVKVPQAAIVGHLTREPAAFEPRFAVPDGFSEWVATLLEKPWQKRFRRAADAAWALRELGTVDDEGSVDVPEDFRATLVDTEVSLAESWRLTGDVDTGLTPTRISAGPPAVPMAKDWRSKVPDLPPMQLVGAGLSLYGLRDPGLVGRTAERDVLWKALREVSASGRGQAVVVHGPAGTGKSRLAQWLQERAHETGAASPLKAVFSPETPPGDALQRMGIDFLELRGMAQERMVERIDTMLRLHGMEDEDQITVLKAMLSAETSADLVSGKSPVRFSRYSEYYTGTRACLYGVSWERPVLVWLDDVQWGPEGIGFARQVLRTQEEQPFPILLVLTVRDEALVDGSLEHRLLDSLRSLPACQDMPLGPLEPAAHRELVQRLLGLEGSLAAQIAERTAGNPLFATQLVGSCVHQGILEVTSQGFAPKKGARVELPDDLHGAWTGHIDDILARFEGDARRYLEVAAILGHEVHWKEWKRACDDPSGYFGDRFPGDDRLRSTLVDELLERRLAVGTAETWSFVHGMLRESLERSAREHGRHAELHLACATMLGTLASPAVAERRGRHLLAAGRPDEAVTPLLDGIQNRLVTVGPGPARALVKMAEQALADAGVPPTDPRWGRAALLGARVLEQLGQLDAAMARADDAAAAADTHQWSTLAIEAQRVRADLLLASRKLEEADAAYQALADLATARDDPGLLGAALMGLADVARRRQAPEALGRAQLAVDAYQTALSRDDTDSWRLGIADARRLQGLAAEASGDLDAASTWFTAARAAYEELGAGVGAAECDERLGRLLLASGALGPASEALQRALSRYEAFGSHRQFACRARLAVALLRGGAGPDPIWTVVEGARTALSEVDPKGRPAASMAFDLVRAALDEDWHHFDSTFAAGAASMPHRGFAPAVVATVGQVAGELAWRAGETTRGGRILQTAEMIWTMAGNKVGVTDVQQGRRFWEEH